MCVCVCVCVYVCVCVCVCVCVHIRVHNHSVMWIHAVRRLLMNFISSVCTKHTHAVQSTPISSTATDQLKTIRITTNRNDVKISLRKFQFNLVFDVILPWI